MQESSLRTVGAAADGSTLCISLLCVYVFGTRNGTIPSKEFISFRATYFYDYTLSLCVCVYVCKVYRVR